MLGHSFTKIRIIFCALLTSAALLLPAAAFAASVTTQPNVGPSTSKVLVGGNGFQAIETVDIYFDKTDLALAATNQAGSFAGIALKIPKSALPGKHWVTAKGRRSQRSAQVAFTVRADWPQLGFTSNNQNFNPYENVLNPSNVAKLTLLWKEPGANDRYFNPPAVAGGIIYACGEPEDLRSTLWALDATTGSGGGRRLNNYISCLAPAVVGGIVYIGDDGSDYSSPGRLHAFNTATGQTLWEKEIPVSGTPQPIVGGGRVYVNGDKLYALNATNGKELWTSNLGGVLAVASGRVYTGAGNKLHALNTKDGALLWSATAGSGFSAVAVANGVVNASADKLYAFTETTGRQLWSAAVTGSLAVANGVVYVNTSNSSSNQPGKLHAFNVATGKQLWSTALRTANTSRPAVANGVIYMGGDKLYAFSAATGKLLWSSVIGEYAAEPILVNGVVYTSEGHVEWQPYAYYITSIYAFGLNGQARSSASLTSESQPPDPATLELDWGLEPAEPAALEAPKNDSSQE